MTNDGTRPATAAENRAYFAKIKHLKRTQGRAAADAFINEEHRKFLASQAAHRKRNRK